jgi:2-succinyl-5-enolpyruvyl-6-hydroxy-3-cyclohexene-1-carboxylate synthase
LFAEPSSRARTGPSSISLYRLLLQGSELPGEIERVLVFGHPTLSRPISKLLARADVQVIVVSPTGLWHDPAHHAKAVVSALEVTGPDATDWLARWQDADQAARPTIDKVLADGLSGPRVAALVGEAVGADGMLVVASSNPVRDLDLAPVVPIRTIANRGLAGIDGTISTAVGAALANAGPTHALIGDLAFLHDSNGLIIGPDEARPDLRIVVVNDNGGGIFSTLEQGDPAHATHFERVFGTPHNVDLSALCAASGTAYTLVHAVDELRAALVPAVAGLSVVEVRISRDGHRPLGQSLVDAIKQL